MEFRVRNLLVVAFLLISSSVAAAAETATGVVFDDANGNGKLDAGEKPLSGVSVSNGTDVVQTDAEGRYRLEVGDDTIIFVIKPAGWQTPLSKDNLPRFFYIHKPEGSPNSQFAGVKPTGPLPESIDFPLHKQEERDPYQVILFGDTQSRNERDLGFLMRDILPEVVGTSAAFGVTLGDIVFNNPAIFEPQADVLGKIGIPWYNVMGNHDLNFGAKDDVHSDETYERIFGPACYSYNYGKGHFVVLDDIEWLVDPKTGKGHYEGAIGEKQLTFLKNDLALVPDDRLVVLMMHIPLNELKDAEAVYRLIENRPHCISISGHTHTHAHCFLGEKDGWRGKEPHHHIVNVTACGNWWNGMPDERGIPHTTMSDGAPNGYSILNIDGNRYTLDFHAASRGAEYQMEIHVPGIVAPDKTGETEVVANIFNGSERSTVRMRVDEGDWVIMKPDQREDPGFARLHRRDEALEDNDWGDLGRPSKSSHIWIAVLPKNMAPGAHVVEVETTDMHGRVFVGKRIVRVK